MSKVLSNATGVDTLISSATIPMTEKLSFHCSPEVEGDTDARPSISESESDLDQDLADGTLSGSMGGGEGKSKQQEEGSYRQREKEADTGLDSQFNASPVRPFDEPNTHPSSSSGWRELDISVVISILTPLLSWAFGREYMKNVLVAIFLVYYLHQLIEGSCAREVCLTLLILGRLGPVQQFPGNCITRRVGNGLRPEYLHQSYRTERNISENSLTLNCGATRCRIFASPLWPLSSACTSLRP